MLIFLNRKVGCLRARIKMCIDWMASGNAGKQGAKQKAVQSNCSEGLKRWGVTCYDIYLEFVLLIL